MRPSDRYIAALQVNHDLLQRAQMAWICTQGFDAAGVPTHLVAKLCLNALFNDYMTKCAKVFEQGRQAASLWYVYRTDQESFMRAVDGRSDTLERMTGVSSSLKHIRDRDLMHVDKDGVLDRNSVWKAAALDPVELQGVVRLATRALERLADMHQIGIEVIPRGLTGALASRVARHLYSYVG